MKRLPSHYGTPSQQFILQHMRSGRSFHLGVDLCMCGLSELSFTENQAKNYDVLMLA